MSDGKCWLDYICRAAGSNWKNVHGIMYTVKKKYLYLHNV